MEEVLRRAVDGQARDARPSCVVRAGAVGEHRRDVDRGAVRLHVRGPPDHAEARGGRAARAVERNKAQEARLVAEVRWHQEGLPGRGRDRGSRDGGVVGTAASGDKASRQVVRLVGSNDDVGRHVVP